MRFYQACHQCDSSLVTLVWKRRFHARKLYTHPFSVSRLDPCQKPLYTSSFQRNFEDSHNKLTALKIHPTRAMTSTMFSTTSATSSSQASNMLERLPAELRLGIYHHVFTTSSSNDWRGLLSTNRLIRDEVNAEYPRHLRKQINDICRWNSERIGLSKVLRRYKRPRLWCNIGISFDVPEDPVLAKENITVSLTCDAPVLHDNIMSYHQPDDSWAYSFKIPYWSARDTLIYLRDEYTRANLPIMKLDVDMNTILLDSEHPKQRSRSVCEQLGCEKALNTLRTSTRSSRSL